MKRDELLLQIGFVKGFEEGLRIANAIELVGGDASIVRRAIQFKADQARAELDKHVLLEEAEEARSTERLSRSSASSSGAPPGDGHESAATPDRVAPLGKVIPIRRGGDLHSVNVKYHPLWEITRPSGESA